MADIGRQHFQMHFMTGEELYFDLIFTEVSSLAPNLKAVSTGSGNGLVSHKWHVIMWTKDEPREVFLPVLYNLVREDLEANS